MQDGARGECSITVVKVVWRYVELGAGWGGPGQGWEDGVGVVGAQVSESEGQPRVLRQFCTPCPLWKPSRTTLPTPPYS